MDNNAMRERIRRNNKVKKRPSRQNFLSSQSCSNRRARRRSSASRPANPSHRIAAVPRTAGERAGSQNRSRVSAGVQGPLSAFPRSKRIQQQPRTSPTPTNTTRRRRQRTRPRSTPNNQSGGPVGGDLAVPGDQPTSPQPPEELREQTENTAEIVRLDVCRPQTPSPRTSSTRPHGSCSESSHRAVPARWTFLRKHVQKARESQGELNQCSPIDTEPLDVPTAPEVTSQVPECSKMAGTVKIPTTESVEVVPHLQTGFYFGSSVRQSWPHTVASAEYFTAVSNRRMKKLEPLFSDDITTTFEVDEDDPIEKRRSAKRETNEQVVDAASNTEAAAAAKIGCSVRDKRSSRNPHRVRKARQTSSTTSRACRRARFSKTSTTRIHGTVMHNVLKLHAVGHHRNKKHPKKHVDSQRRGVSNDPIRPNATPMTPIRRVLSPERESYKSSSASSGPSNQDKSPHRRQSNHNSVKEDEKHSVIQQNSRKNTHKHSRRHPHYHRHQIYQQRRALKGQQRLYSDAPQRAPCSQPLVDNQNMYGTFIPHLILRGINKYRNANARGSESFQEPEYSSVETSYRTETDTLETTATLSGYPYQFDLADETFRIEGTSQRSPHCVRMGITDPKIKNAAVANILENQKDISELGLYDFEHQDQIQTVRQDRNNCPQFICSKLGSKTTINAQLFINHVLRKPTGSTEYVPNNVATMEPDDRSKIPPSDNGISQDTTEHTRLHPEVNKNCIRGVSLDTQNIDNSDFLIRSLVKSSVEVQNVLFPHLNTAKRASKTTQITPEDLICVLINTVGAGVPEHGRTLHDKNTSIELPLQGAANALTSPRKVKKAVRQKNKINVLAKPCRPHKYKFVKRASQNSASKLVSTTKRTLTPTSNANSEKEHDVTEEQSIFEVTPKLIQKKFQAQSTRDIDGPMSSACTPQFKLKPHRLLRLQQNMEDNSRSELVSLFRADTRGSSIQSVEVNSSSSTYGGKPIVSLESGKKAKGAVLPPKSRTHAKHPEDVNHTGPESQSKKRNNIGSPGTVTKNERIRKTTIKRSVGAKPKAHIPPSDIASRAISPKQRDTVTNTLPTERQKSSASIISNYFVQRAYIPKLPRDSLRGPLKKTWSPTPVSNTVTFRPPSDSVFRRLKLEKHEKTGSKTSHPDAMSDTGSKTHSPRLSSDLATVQTTRRQSSVISAENSSKTSSGLVQKIQYATSPIASNTIEFSHKSSTDSRQKSRTPKSRGGGTPTSLQSHTSVFPKLLSLTSKPKSLSSPKPPSPTSSKPRSPTLPKSQIPPPLKISPIPTRVYTPTPPRSCSPTLGTHAFTSPRPHTTATSYTPVSARNTKKTAYHFKLRDYLESRMHPLRLLPDQKPNEHVVNSMIEPEQRSPVQESTPQSNNTLSPKQRKLVKKRRAPSPPFVSKPSNTKDKDIQILDKDSKNQSQLVFDQSMTEKNRSNYSIKQNLPPPPSDMEKNEVGAVRKLQSHHDSFPVDLRLNENPMYFGKLPLLEISTSFCSCELNNRGCSFSSTSMIPAVGSYEDRFLSSTIWRKADDYSYKILCGEKSTYKGTPESPLLHHALQSLEEPHSDIQQKPRNSTKEYSGNTKLIMNFSALPEDLGHHQYANTYRVDGTNNKGRDDNVPTTIRGKSESRSDSSTDRETEPNQLELCCGLVESHEPPGESRDMSEGCFVEKIQESVSTTGIVPQRNKSRRSTSYSAVSSGLSVNGGISSQDATESCQIYTHSNIVSSKKQAAPDGSSLTDAVSCISSIPEDTLPNVADSDSTTCHPLPEEFSCSCREQATKESIFPDNYIYCYCDQSWPSVSHLKSSVENPIGMAVLKQHPCDIENAQLQGTPGNEPYKRSHGRSLAAMHVTWDVAMKNGCVHAKCSRCGALGTEKMEKCHPVTTYWHEPKVQDGRNYSKGNRYLRCGRCITCLREQQFTKDRWSQSSTPISSLSCTRHMLYREKHLDHTLTNSDHTATNVLQNNIDASCKIATTVEIRQEDLLDTKTEVFRTSNHSLSKCNFPQTPQSRKACIPDIPPIDKKSRKVLHPDSKPPTFLTPAYNPSQLSHERDDNHNYRKCSHPIKSPQTTVASLWPTTPTPESQSKVHIPTFDKTKELKMKSPCCHRPHLTLSPVHTTSLPEDIVFEGTSLSYNKDIVLQRVADRLETRSSILSIDSCNKTVSKEIDCCLGTFATKPISKFSHNIGVEQRLSAATSINEPPDVQLERIVAEIADRVNNFLRDMTLAVGELHNVN